MKKNPPPSDLLFPREAARILHRTTKTLHRWYEQGILRGFARPVRHAKILYYAREVYELAAKMEG